MLTIWGPRQSLCDRISRRSFLKVGALGLGGLTLADVLRLQAHGANTPKPRHKAVIMVFLEGGPSHQDTYDMKPAAPAEYRGEFKTIQTNVPGIDICELMPLQAKIADKLAILRGVQFGLGAHYKELVFTGFARPAPARPAFGSVVSWFRRDGALPSYVSLCFAPADDERPLYLGTAHRPFVPEGSGLENLRLARGLTQDQLADRKELLGAFDTIRRDIDGKGDMAGMNAFTARALEIITSDKARDAFDIYREPPEVRAKYNVKSHDGREVSAKFLMARRLVEAGVSVVTLTCTQGWDTHADNFKRLRSPLLPELDRNIHALVTDLHERGLDKDVAVVVWGEMGRTPKINDKAGRDHWGEAGIALLAGGGLQMGQVVGATDAHAARPTTLPYTPQNVLATLYHVLGIDPSLTVNDYQGRPVNLLDDPKKIEELL
jgi:hypothetical protein